MRVSDNITIYAGGESYATNAAEQQGKKQGGSIFAGDLRQNFCEDRIAQRKEKVQKQASEELLEEMPVEEILTLEQMKQDVQKQVQNIVDKMKLVAEDIKGALVDQSI